MYLLDGHWNLDFCYTYFCPHFPPIGIPICTNKKQKQNKTKQNKKQKHQTKTKTKKHICAHQIDTQFKYIGCLHLQLKLPDHYIYEELVSKISYIHPDMLLILYYWLPFAIKIVQVSQDKFLLWVTFIWPVQNVYKVIKSGNEWHAGVDRRCFGTKQDYIPLFFFMYVQILWQGQKAVL